MTHLIKTVMVYPPGHVPSGWDAPADYVPEGCIEDYDLAFADEAPVVGQQFDAYGHRWAISRVQSYLSLEPLEEAAEGFHLAIATLDGSVPVRESWDGAAPLLVVHAAGPGQLVCNEYGAPHWELVEREDWIAPVEGMVIETVQHFEVAGEPAPGDYNRVVVAWSVDEIALGESATVVAA